MKKLYSIKKLIYLCTLLSLIFVFGGISSAKEVQQNLQITSSAWQPIEVGPAEIYSYEFNTETIKYDRNNDGSINKNIIIYDEKKTNTVSMSAEFNYYSITNCKINIDMQSICFGNESFYTKKGKFRWTDTPQFLTWITVKPETLGGMRFIQIVEYARAHDAELIARS